MARRSIHYEAAFEDYVRSRGWPYVSVDEQKRAIFAGARVKTFDFLVYPPDRPACLVDVKGRQFPYECAGGGKHYWENWITRRDMEGLRQWKRVFGDGFDPVIVFVYWLRGLLDPGPSAEVHAFRNQYYAFLWVDAEDYGAHARSRSAKWDTVSVPRAAFRRMVGVAPSHQSSVTPYPPAI